MSHTVAVRPASAGAETLAVLRAAAVIALLSLAAIRFHAAAPGQPGDALLPFQSRFSTLSATEQRLFRQLQEGIAEIENSRAADQAWPSVEALSAAGVPPFAPDPIAPSARTWTLRQSGLETNYLGLPDPARRDDKTWLVLFEEPDPGTSEATQPAQVLLDEIHHRLPNGSIVHVSIWSRASPPSDPLKLVDKPFQEGWTQLVVGSKP